MNKFLSQGYREEVSAIRIKIFKQTYTTLRFSRALYKSCWAVELGLIHLQFIWVSQTQHCTQEVTSVSFWNTQSLIIPNIDPPCRMISIGRERERKKSRSPARRNFNRKSSVYRCERQPRADDIAAFPRTSDRHCADNLTSSPLPGTHAIAYFERRGAGFARQPERRESIKKCRFSGGKERNWRRSNLSPREGSRERPRLGTARARARPLSRQIARYGEFPRAEILSWTFRPTDTFLQGCCSRHDYSTRHSTAVNPRILSDNNFLVPRDENDNPR